MKELEQKDEDYEILSTLLEAQECSDSKKSDISLYYERIIEDLTSEFQKEFVKI